ncbi:Glutamate--cysteine ligase catalytic subunit [Trichoplax sp. H2]|nr:Glutamate--cysteine ligase catalytic subunit [Trichoplax sp. H2]|eukprot:RDD36149.1 Glutamate--cysteine ligase catalytic subunit [Trichoplax sp. H2]
MGILTNGTPLTWDEIKEYITLIKSQGIRQFISLYHRLSNRPNDILKWGDELEYMVVKFDHENKTARLYCEVDQYLDILQNFERENPGASPTSWKPEFTSYMLEASPGQPYLGDLAQINSVEANMKRRRREVIDLLDEDIVPITLTAFPRLGCPNFTYPAYEPDTNKRSSAPSLFFPWEVVGSHPRFKSFSQNIYLRRGSKVAINVPVFRDVNTPKPFVEHLQYGEEAIDGKEDHIYLDATGHGHGNSCLQVTLQAYNVDEARLLYDQLCPICPIVLALSAASPIYRGFLSDVDCRWNIISQSVDDRTKEERGLEPLKNNKHRIPKSRYDSVDYYLSPEGQAYNDIELVYDKEFCEQLEKAGVDSILARHIAHLFIREPISVFKELLEQDDLKDSDHFENIQSTNWQTMRFKPPPLDADIGWRVEFRPCEVQLTEFENAAFAAFIILLTRVILTYGLNFYMPISKVDENMQTAQKRDAVRNGMFYFRKDLGKAPSTSSPPDESEYELMSINTIINGKADGFPGLVPLINDYLASLSIDFNTRCSLYRYLSLIQKRASGELKTTAKWMRDFVASHPDYKKDSVVSEKINYDLLYACNEIVQGKRQESDFIDNMESKTIDSFSTT